MKKLAFIGAGSHADAVLPVVNRSEYEFIGFFDDKDIKSRAGFSILGKISEVEEFLADGRVDYVFITIGENQKRAEIFNKLKENYYERIANIISDKAHIITATSIKGRGIFVGFTSFIGAQVEVYDNSIINTGAIVEHHTTVKSHCNICPNATINGYGTINEGVYIGSASVVIQLIEIAKWSTIGAGAVVLKTLGETGIYVGVPAKKIK